MIRIGSRGSDLALWQAHFFQDQLSDQGVASSIKIIKTQGDQIQHLSFDKLEGKGFFTKEIEQQLLDGEIDVAIHSHKDLETENPAGLIIAGVSYREDPAELLLIHPNAYDGSKEIPFKVGAKIGTSSARRKAQISALRPDIAIEDIRGNVPTRVEKLRSGQFDAILLANAGVSRLKLDVTDLHPTRLDERIFIPAPAQGVLAYQCRENDQKTIASIQNLHHSDVRDIVQIERGILSRFGGGCHKPIGVHVSHGDNYYDVRCIHAKEWTDTPFYRRFQSPSVESALSAFDTLLSKELPSSLFISRPIDSEGFLASSLLAHGVDYIDESLIETKPLSFEIEGEFNWVFFSSSNGVKSFFAQEDVSAWQRLKIGAFGTGTATTLKELGLAVSFTGNSSSPENVAQDFRRLVGEAQVLFPVSDQSLLSVPKVFPSGQYAIVETYSTEALNRTIPSQEAYVFTSPSNVRSFLASNQLNPPAKCISIGASTAKELSAHGIESKVASIPHEVELWALIAS